MCYIETDTESGLVSQVLRKSSDKLGSVIIHVLYIDIQCREIIEELLVDRGHIANPLVSIEDILESDDIVRMENNRTT